MNTHTHTHTHSLSLLGNLRGLARRVGPWTLITQLRHAAVAVLREVWEIINAATTVRGELRRMADECEASRPEYAARLRKVACSDWLD